MPSIPLNKVQKFIIILLSATNSGLFILLHWLLPQFKLTFQSFDTSLPLLTNIFLALIPVYIPAAIISLLPAVALLHQDLKFSSSIVKFTAFLTLFTATLTLIAFYSMYLPIFGAENR